MIIYLKKKKLLTKTAQINFLKWTAFALILLLMPTHFCRLYKTEAGTLFVITMVAMMMVDKFIK